MSEHSKNPDLRVGLGYDLHRLVEGRPLILGGITIPHEMGPLGHSDADVVLHALTDAVLGAAGLPDIGELFPDTDPAHKNANSKILLQKAMLRVHEAGFTIGNVDIVVHVQQPRLSPHKPAMIVSIAEALGCATKQVNLKSKTNEGVDAVGRGEAIACTAVVLLNCHSERSEESHL